ncbi:Uncharacterised protein [Bordetella pertussis]|nr:Uncharacterised protein [Bordetella pertussis]CFP60095.1 Uncharacterised protein [Bordetella pertussis]
MVCAERRTSSLARFSALPSSRVSSRPNCSACASR